jgi:hypothetical protein
VHKNLKANETGRHVACIEQQINAYKILVWKPGENILLERVDINGMIIFKWTLRKQDWRMQTESMSLLLYTVMLRRKATIAWMKSRHSCLFQTHSTESYLLSSNTQKSLKTLHGSGSWMMLGQLYCPD